ncbi:MAG: hypothetical protein LBG44_10105 [Gemmatimonadota bacterium]|jgi:hypothetical protein|nr:hypothetical protein [Gemmatimonadota bacterium]
MSKYRISKKNFGVIVELTVMAIILAMCDFRTDMTVPLEPIAISTLPGVSGSIDTSRDEVVDILDQWPENPRVSLGLSAAGTFRPGEPIELHVQSDARYPVQSAHIRLYIPEYEAGRLTNFGDRFQIPINVSLPTVADWELERMEIRQQVARSTQINIPSPGYYQVIAVVDAKEPIGDKVDLLSQPVANTYVLERWLYIGADGGRLTDYFDTDLIPAGMVRNSGPFREIRSDKDSRLVANVESAGSGSSLAANDNVVYLVYWDIASGSYKPAIGGSVLSGKSLSGIMIDGPTQVIGVNGFVTLPCSNGTWYVTSTLNDPRFNVSSAYYQEEYLYCGDTRTLVTGLGEYDAFVRLKSSIPAIVNAIGYNRSSVTFLVNYPGSPCSPNSCYSPAKDKVYIPLNHAIGWHWALTHEYGHALNNASLGGLWNAANCSVHEVYLVSSYSCALLEGFADYIGTLGASVVGTVDPGLNWDVFRVYVPNNSGAIEGNVAALFYHLAGLYSPYYVSTVFKTCNTKTASSGWQLRSTVHQLIWCLENRTNASVQSAHFPGTTLWTGYSESAVEPAGWNADVIRSLWIALVGN